MSNIAQKAIVLKLNKNWQAVEVAIVQDVIPDLVTGVLQGLDIEYVMKDEETPDTTQYNYVRPVEWDEWMTLPVRPWDFAIHTPKQAIRVPTVVITKKYDKMPMKHYKGKPTKEALFYRDGGRCIYTGRKLDYDEATIDHVLARSRGGEDSFENTGLTTKELNNRKGNLTPKEVGLKPLWSPSAPKPVPIWMTIRKIRHADWKFFLELAK